MIPLFSFAIDSVDILLKLILPAYYNLGYKYKASATILIQSSVEKNAALDYVDLVG